MNFNGDKTKDNTRETLKKIKLDILQKLQNKTHNNHGIYVRNIKLRR